MTLNEMFVDVSPWVKLTGYYVAAGAGMAGHWLKSHMTEQTQTRLRDWFFTEFKSTALTVGSVMGTSLPAIAPMDLSTTSLLTFLTMGFSLGFTSDSVFNSETPIDNTPRS